ncbi:VWA domain-containing protein [Amycolatopsis sp. cg9]|uniref:VWA domain-containing protein n=1 Tax=Amycolatopsis sp. cg9 TaxID=3238801 RepID=UPI0035240AC4
MRAMKARALGTAALVLGALIAAAPSAAADTGPGPVPPGGFAAMSAEYSQAALKSNPVLGDLLRGLGLKRLDQLDPAKIYTIDRATQKITSAPAGGAAISSGLFFGIGSVVTDIRASGTDILGTAKTVVTCPFGAQTAQVSGFMASTVSRDPRGGIRQGTIYADDFLTTGAEVDFRILKAAGGARNPINRTAMETTHTGSCGGEVKVQNVVSTWPPLRATLAIDDTGSMSDQLGGVKAGLASFIESQGTDYNKTQRGVSYEVVSFKDTPTLRLANTTDTAAVINTVNSLEADGGDDCPEDSLGAVNLALDRMTGDEDSAGQIVLATDASPHSSDISAIVARARSLGVPVNVMLSGDCTGEAGVASRTAQAQNQTSSTAVAADEVPSSRVVFEQLARETGGRFYYEPGAGPDRYAAILGEILNEASVPTTTITAAAGTGQSTPAGTAFPLPLTAAVATATSAPLADVPVTFTIDGPATFPGGATTALVTTGADGRAIAPALTATATPGTVTVAATAPSTTTPATFTATVTDPVPAAVTAVSGSGQSTIPGTPFTAPLTASVTNTIGAPAANAPVTFTVTAGTATFPGGAATATATTGANGQAVAPTLTAGTTTGPVTITATTPGVTSPATFTATIAAPPGPARADLALTLTGPATTTSGSPFTMTLTVRNNGPATATAVVAGMSLPKGLRVTNAGGGIITDGGRLAAFVVPSMGTTKSVTYKIIVTPDRGMTGTQTIAAAGASLKVGDPNYRNNLTTAQVNLRK